MNDVTLNIKLSSRRAQIPDWLAFPDRLKFRHVFYALYGAYCGYLAGGVVIAISSALISTVIGHIWYDWVNFLLSSDWTK